MTMKKIFLSFLIATIGFSADAICQKFESGGEYLDYINQIYKPIQQDFMTYANAVARGKSAKKVDNKRKEISLSVKDGLRKVQALPPFKGDKSYKDSTIKFLNLNYKILNDDYSKIVDLEAVAEQSYDAMEAYYLVQDIAAEKIDRAGNMLDSAFTIFANKHDVKINKNPKENELTKKVKKASATMAYQRKIYLIFFKPYKQEAYLLNALSKKDMSGVEQNQNSLLSLAQEALQKLDTCKPYNNDKTLINATRELQNFYIDECKTKFQVAIDFILKEEDFLKAKKTFEAKDAQKLSKEEVDSYNKKIAEYNKILTTYNNNNAQLDAKRKTLITKWNTTSQSFLDNHVPKY